MQRDDERNLKAAFAELRRRQHKQAPPFGAMHDEAMRRHGAEQRPSRQNSGLVSRFAWAAAACALAMGSWWSGRPEPASRGTAQAGATEHVDRMVAMIVLELSEPADDLDYPTDRLLAENENAFSP